MKLVQIFSLTAIAAIAAMAFIGTSPASAETSVLLCKEPELECTSPWPNGTTIVGHATSPKLVTSLGTVTCEKSLTELSLLQEEFTELQLAHILSLSFEGNCHLGKSTPCEVTVEEVGGLSFTHGANPLEWAGVPVPLPLGETSMNTVFHVNCSGLNCTYELGEETVMTATNGAEGDITLVAKEAALEKFKGLFCPKTSKWTATYLSLVGDLWLESSLGLAENAALLCKNKGSKCTNPWPNGTTIVAHATNPKLVTSVGTVTCEKSLTELTLLQEKLAELQLAHILSLSFEGNCHLGKSTPCEVTVEEVGGLSFTHGANPLEWAGVPVPLPLGETSMNTVFHVNCSSLNCTYELGEEIPMTATNGAEGDLTLITKEAKLEKFKGLFCPATSKWTATYLSLVGGLWLES